MATDVLKKLFEHGNWANREIVRACAELSAENLDATPLAAGAWSIRENLVHLVACQEGYLALLTLPPEQRQRKPPAFEELEARAAASGDALLALAERAEGLEGRLTTTDGYRVEPWVVLLQAVHHATEHRKQIAALLRALDLEPPWIDGWAFGEARGALVRITESE